MANDGLIYCVGRRQVCKLRGRGYVKSHSFFLCFSCGREANGVAGLTDFVALLPSYETPRGERRASKVVLRRAPAAVWGWERGSRALKG